jgi:hypothetical protein
MMSASLLEKHLAQHLIQIAMHYLPPTDDNYKARQILRLVVDYTAV